MFTHKFNSFLEKTYQKLKNRKPTGCHLLFLFCFLDTQHVSDINMPIFRSLRLCCWTTTLAVLFLDCCVLELGCGSAGVVSGLSAVRIPPNTMSSNTLKLLICDKPFLNFYVSLSMTPVIRTDCTTHSTSRLRSIRLPHTTLRVLTRQPSLQTVCPLGYGRSCLDFGYVGGHHVETSFPYMCAAI